MTQLKPTAKISINLGTSKWAKLGGNGKREEAGQENVHIIFNTL